MLQKHLVPFAVLDKIISNISIIMLFAQATPSNQEKETTGMNCIGNETNNCSQCAGHPVVHNLH